MFHAGAKHGLGLLVVLALGATATAADSPELRKRPPDLGTQTYRARIEALIDRRYPELLTRKFEGTPVVTVLFGFDGQVQRSDFQVIADSSPPLTVSESQFQRFHLSAGELRYIGTTRLVLPLNRVLVAFAGRDSREVDSALVERLFPAISDRPIGAKESLWILFDSQGRILRHGREVLDTDSLAKGFETRYRNVHVGDATVTPAFGRDGSAIRNAAQQPVVLCSIWLARDSALPEH